MALPSLASHSAAVLAALKGTGLLTGDGRAPEGGGWQGEPGQSQFTAYVFLTDIPVSSWDGTIADPFESPGAEYQVTCVGANADHARRIADTVRAAVVAMTDTVHEGYKVDRVRFPFSSVNTVPDRATNPSLHYVPLRVAVKWTPA